jgi:hypothetical protein
MRRLTETLSSFGRILLWITLACGTSAAVFAVWLFFYKSDLPDVSAMSVYSPNGPVVISTSICGETAHVVAIPSGNARILREAVLAAEGDFYPRSSVWRYYDELSSNAQTPRFGHYSDGLARDMLCGFHGGNLKRIFSEIRTTIQLERQFNHDQLMDIYLNRVYLGPGIYGVEEAAQQYFGKHAEELSITEAALLAGLIQRPAYDSPRQHPDRALARRNEVIDAMARRGSITRAQADVFKGTPLGTLY